MKCKLLMGLALLSTGALAQAPAPGNGEALYGKRCAICHEQAVPRALPRNSARGGRRSRYRRGQRVALMTTLALQEQQGQHVQQQQTSAAAAVGAALRRAAASLKACAIDVTSPKVR